MPSPSTRSLKASRQRPRSGALARTNPSLERLFHLGFLVTIAYAVLILGITFRDTNPLDPLLHPLAVTVVNTRSEAAPRKVHVYAQVNSRGGSHHPKRAIQAARLPSGQINQNGKRQAHDPSQSRRRSPALESHPSQGEGSHAGSNPTLVSQAPNTRRILSRLDAPLPGSAPLKIEHLMLASHSPLPPITESRSTDAGSDALAPEPWPALSTQALALARYLDAWRKRIERVGNGLLIQQGPHPGLHGRLLLAVTLRADGSIAALHFVREAHNTSLDRLALETIREAQPFPPLPNLRSGQGSFRFIYEWRFFKDHATAAVAPANRIHS